MQRSLSIVIASYNEESNIGPLHQRLKDVLQKIGCEYEIIFVDNQSTDQSSKEYLKICEQDEFCKVLYLSRNFGSSQPAFCAGMEVAQGDGVVLMDGDQQDPPELIESFYEKWQEDYDVVYGSRKKRLGSLIRRIGYWGFYRIFQKVAYVPIPLDAGDFALMDRRVVDAINRCPESKRYIRGIRSWVGFKQIGVSYTRDDRSKGQTTNSFLDNFSWAKRAIFNFSFLPLKLITLMMLFALGIGFSVLLALLGGEPKADGFELLLLFLILFFGLMQMVCFFILGSYIKIIFGEVKRRPLYIIEKQIGGKSIRSLDK